MKENEYVGKHGRASRSGAMPASAAGRANINVGRQPVELKIFG
jgi:hypothetical protein